MQAVTEVLNKSHFSLQMGNCPIPIAEHSGHLQLATTQNFEILLGTFYSVKSLPSALNLFFAIYN